MTTGVFVRGAGHILIAACMYIGANWSSHMWEDPDKVIPWLCMGVVNVYNAYRAFISNSASQSNGQ